MNKLHLLILEDSLDDSELAVKELEREGFIVEWSRVDTKKTFKEALAEKPDLILADFSLPSFNGMAAIKIHRKVAPEIPLIIFSGTIGEEIAVECLKSGATDYVLKDNLSRLGPVVKRALEEAVTHRERKQAEEALQESEEKYRSLIDDVLDSSAVGIFILDSDFRVVWVNRALEDYFGLKRDEIIGKDKRQLIREKIKDIFENPDIFANKVFTTYDDNTYIDRFECHVLHNGEREERWLEHRSYPILSGLYAGGRIEHYYDISERKQAEEKEKEHHKNIELLSDTAMRFIEFPQDKDIYTFIGDQLQEITGKDSYVIVNSIDTENNILTTRAAIGMGKLSEKVAGLLGKHPVGMTYNAKDEDLFYLSDGKLHLYEEGLYGILLKTVPKIACKSVEKLLKIKRIYTIGFTKENVLFGSIVIALKEGADELKNKQIIEAFLKQASIAVQKRQAEEALRKSNENFQQVVSNITTVVWKADIGNNGAFENTYTSPVADELLELPAGTMKNDWNKFFSYIKPEYLERVNNAFREAIISPGKEIDCEYEALKNNGQTAWFYSNGRCFEKNGKSHVFGSTIDITERKQAEEELLESEEKYRLLAENTIDCIWKMDKNLRFTYINPSIFNMLGFTPEEWIGSSLSEHCSKKEMQKVLGLIAEEMNKESYITALEMFLIHKDGREIPVEIRNEIFIDNNKNLIEFQGTTLDITERKQAEEERKKLEAQLHQSQKMEAVGTLAGGIAHDFNNILSAVIGYTEVSLVKVEKGTSLQTNLQEVLKAGIRAKDLVQQILTFSRQSEQEQGPVQISLMVKEALKLLRASLPTTIEIQQDIQSNSAVLGNPTQIHQVVMNLCTNAGHAMQKDGGILEVSLVNVEVDADFAARHLDMSPGPHLRLTVSDTGYGMSPDVLECMFNPFFTTKEKGEGTGMGLSVVHGIVKDYSGAITVYSEPGSGSTFNVFLPVFEGEAKLETKTEEPLPHGNECILFIDDELVIVDIGRQILERLGYEVVTRTSSIEALELFRAKPDRFDLVITDMTMPKMTGEEIAREVMLIRPDIPVILCTGFSEKMTAEKAKAIGVKAFLMKPIIMSVTAGTVRQVLDQ